MTTPQIIRGSAAQLLLLLLAGGCIDGYRPVVIVHGILDGPKQFQTLRQYITKAHPGTEVPVISLYNDMKSFLPLWKQVRDFSKAIESISQNAPDGIHLLCFSQGQQAITQQKWTEWLFSGPTMTIQYVGGYVAYSIQYNKPGNEQKSFDVINVMGGTHLSTTVISSPPDLNRSGLICRALLFTTPRHNVHNFISLSSPQAGQYGDTTYLRWLFPQCLKKTVYKICYSRFGQSLSICQYWNDPHHRSLYLQRNNFLTKLDGERSHADMTAWRENFLRIKKLVLIGGPDDGVITPWESSRFGFYDSNENVVEMRNQEFYKSDVFGLKTLDARGDVRTCIQSGVKHVQWHSNHTVFKSCIEKWLT